MKSVLVTGASSGIGLATAKKFHSENYFVFLLARSKERLLQLQKTLPNSQIIICDLSNFNEIDQAVSIINNSNTQLEVLINNAGIFNRNAIESMTLMEWEIMLKVNLTAPLYLTQKIIPLFKSQKKGSIVMVSSTLGIKTSSQTGAYSASKAALNNLSQTLALELAEYNIRCNVIAPGIVETPIHGFDHMDTQKKSDTLKFYNTLQPLGRIGTPDEIANSVYFIASDLSPWTTGAINIVDGGINLL